MPRGSFEKKTWLYISDGKIREKVEANTPSSEYRKVTMEGEVYELWEKVSDYVDGYITDITIKEGDYGRSLEISMFDGEEKFNVRIRWNSQYAGQFMQKAPNIDFNEAVMILPYYFKEEKKARIVIQQNGVKIDSFYTKDDRKGMPAFPENGNEDDLTLWKVNVSKFFHDELVSKVLPNLKKATLPPGLIVEEVDDNPFTNVEDDLDALPSEPLTDEKRKATIEKLKNAKGDVGNVEKGDPGPDVEDLPF